MKPEEQTILQRHFDNSYFAKNRPESPPKKLVLFNFDNTLFLSPLLSPTIWHESVLAQVICENKFGPGWWKDIRSLEIGPVEEMKEKAWEGFWNENAVLKARQSIDDPDTFTALLSFRPYYPFNSLITTMLESKGLQFDIVALCPDPDQAPEYVWEAVDAQKFKINYHPQPALFGSSIQYKERFILNTLHNVPTLKQITWICNSSAQTKRIKAFLEKLEVAQVISSFELQIMPKLRPAYRPHWEKEVMTHILHSHNNVLEAAYRGTTHQRHDAHLPRFDTKERFVGLEPVCVATSLEIVPESVLQLKKVFWPLFEERMRLYRDGRTLSPGEETPLFFGDMARVSLKKLDYTCCGALGQTVPLVILGVSPMGKRPWLALKVCVSGKAIGKHYHVLPLWFRPSDECSVVKKVHDWLPLTEDQKIELKAIISHEKRIQVSAPKVPQEIKALLHGKRTKLTKTEKRELRKLKPKKLSPDVEMEHILERTNELVDARTHIADNAPKVGDTPNVSNSPKLNNSPKVSNSPKVNNALEVNKPSVSATRTDKASANVPQKRFKLKKKSERSEKKRKMN
ncbi:hypothetical protein G6F62_002841 [Rhizopus arrhizus]|nr:hypothetical protein G6F62_002841 [Rhizopus arrhizus]